MPGYKYKVFYTISLVGIVSCVYRPGPLVKDIWVGHEDSVRSRIQEGADVNRLDYDPRISKPGDPRVFYSLRAGKVTPLEIAIASGNTSIVKLLLKSGASLSTDKRYLLTASWYGFPEIVKLLLDAGVNVDETLPENKRLIFAAHETPLMIAAYHGDVEIAKLLMDHGADVNMKNQYGMTPLFYPLLTYTCITGDTYEDLLRLFAENGARLDVIFRYRRFKMNLRELAEMQKCPNAAKAIWNTTKKQGNSI